MPKKHLGFPRTWELEETFFFHNFIFKSFRPIIGNEVRTDHVSYSIFIFTKKKRKSTYEFTYLDILGVDQSYIYQVL